MRLFVCVMMVSFCASACIQVPDKSSSPRPKMPQMEMGTDSSEMRGDMSPDQTDMGDMGKDADGDMVDMEEMSLPPGCNIAGELVNSQEALPCTQQAGVCAGLSFDDCDSVVLPLEGNETSATCSMDYLEAQVPIQKGVPFFETIDAQATSLEYWSCVGALDCRTDVVPTACCGGALPTINTLAGHNIQGRSTAIIGMKSSNVDERYILVKPDTGALSIEYLDQKGGKTFTSYTLPVAGGEYGLMYGNVEITPLLDGPGYLVSFVQRKKSDPKTYALRWAKLDSNGIPIMPLSDAIGTWFTVTASEALDDWENKIHFAVKRSRTRMWAVLNGPSDSMVLPKNYETFVCSKVSDPETSDVSCERPLYPILNTNIDSSTKQDFSAGPGDVSLEVNEDGLAIIGWEHKSTTQLKSFQTLVGFDPQSNSKSNVIALEKAPNQVQKSDFAIVSYQSLDDQGQILPRVGWLSTLSGVNNNMTRIIVRELSLASSDNVLALGVGSDINPLVDVTSGITLEQVMLKPHDALPGRMILIARTSSKLIIQGVFASSFAGGSAPAPIELTSFGQYRVSYAQHDNSAMLIQSEPSSGAIKTATDILSLGWDGSPMCHPVTN